MLVITVERGNGLKVADQPDHLAKMLAELEARKESLRSRMESLDAAINGLHGLQAAVLKESDEVLCVQPELIREEPAEVLPPLALQTQEHKGSERGDFALKHDSSPAEIPKALKRPLQGSSVERREPKHLNVYVNRNSEWASRQFVPAHSPRVFRHKTGQRCPKCGSQDTRLSVTRGISDCLMFLFDYSLGRCRNCDTKFRIWRSREEDDDQPEADVQPSTK